MTFPGGLLAGSQSAMARLLAQMQGQPQPTPAWNPNANPVQGGMQSLLSQNLSQNPVMGEGPGLMAQPPQEDPAHNHRKGIRGGILHAIGADRTPPELDALLTDEQAKRAQPGLIASVGNFLIRGRTPQQVQMERAATMIGLQDKKVARDTTARQQAMMAQVQQMASTMPPQEAAEFVARMGTVYGLPGFADAAQAAQRTRPENPQQVPRGAAVWDPAQGKYVIPAPITPEPDVPKPVLTERDHLGGKAIFKDGVWDRWVVPPKDESARVQAEREKRANQERVLGDDISGIEDAIAQVDQNKSAFGLKNTLPTVIRQRLPWRNADADATTLGSLEYVIGRLRHDRFGGALSALEASKAARIFSEPSSPPEVVRAQLEVIRKALERQQESIQRQNAPTEPASSDGKKVPSYEEWRAAKKKGTP